MGALSRMILGRETRALTENDVIREWWQGLRGVRTASGATITEVTAMYVMAVVTAIEILAQSVAQTPMKVYRTRSDGGRDEVTTHPLYQLLHDAPNSEMNAFTLRETIVGHLFSWGNAYMEIERNFYDEPIGLWPLLPDRTQARRINGRLAYQTRVQRDPSGQDRGTQITLPARDVIHIPGLGFDGLRGYSVIALIREGIGLSKAYEEFGSRFFGNGAIPGFILSTDKVMTPEKRKEIEQMWLENHTGLTNAQRLAIVDGGLKAEKIGIPPEDAQFLEGRKYQRSEIMGFYRIPPHMSNDTEKVSSWGTGIEQMDIGFTKWVLGPIFKRIEMPINQKLFGANAQGPIFAEFQIDALLRGDFKTRQDGYAVGRQWGWLSANDILRLENLPTIGAKGDVYLVPSGYVDAARLKDIIDKQVEPTPAPAPPAVPAATDGGTTPPSADAPADPAAAARSRSAIARAFRPALADVTDRILRRERADVTRGVEKLLRAGKTTELEPWLESFYRDHREYSQRAIEPILQSLGAAVLADVARECPAESRVGLEGSFVAKYAESYAVRLGHESLEELRRAVRGEPALERAFNAWERRELAIAVRESVRATNAFASAIYRELGAEMRWVKGDDCAPCAALDGRVVRGRGVFSDKISHPPLHEGCECTIVASRSSIRRGAPDSDAVAPQPVHVTVENHIDPGAIQFTIADGAIRSSTPVTIADGAMRAELKLEKGAIDATTKVERGAVSAPITIADGAIRSDTHIADGAIRADTHIAEGAIKAETHVDGAKGDLTFEYKAGQLTKVSRSDPKKTK